MNKKLLFGLMSASMLFAASCTNEVDLEGQNGGEAMVSFQVSTPEIATRAYSDGNTATHLQYAVYDEDKNILKKFTVTDAVINGTTTVNFKLSTQNTYSVLFWAAAPGAPYIVDPASKTMTVDYAESKTFSNDESRDAFYAFETFKVEGTETKTIELKRPFAQLNIGTSDYTLSENAGYVPTHSEVTVKNVYNTLNFETGSVSDEIEVTFGLNEIPEVNPGHEGYERFPVADYEYLAMNYLLVASDKALVDINYTYTDGEVSDSRTIGSVPVQRNYRTNIYGALLTNDVDVIVEIEPAYEEEDNNINVWDGRTLTEPLIDASTKTVTIASGAELAWFAASVNGTLPMTRAENIAPNTYEGWTINMTVNIDLNKKEWAPIKNFKGTFDGKGFTIYNLNVCAKGKEAAGLFASAKIVKNLTVKYATIEGHYKAGVIVGDGLCSRIENCHVENSKVLATPYNNDDANHVGGIVGYLSAENEAYVKNSSVKNAEIIGYRDVAGIAGTANQAAVISGNTLENVLIVADQRPDYVEVKEPNAGYWAGRISAKATITDNNKGENVIVKIYEKGGVIINNGIYEVKNNAELLSVLGRDLSGDVTIAFIGDIEGDATILQEEGLNYTIDGQNYKYDGVITVNGNARAKGAETLTLKNINFVANSGKTFIDAPTKVDGKYNYSHNVTVDNCTFSSADYNEAIVGIKLLTTYNAVVKNCTATNIHTLAQFQSTDNATVIENVKVVNCKNGISLGNIASATITNAEISAKGYGVRLDGAKERTVSATITGCTINAFIPVNVRKMNNDDCNVEVNLEGENYLTGDSYEIAFCSNEFEEGVEPVAPMGTYTLTGAQNFDVYFGTVNSSSALSAAINSNLEEIDVNDNIENVGNGFEISRDVVLNFNNHELNAGSTANSTWYAIQVEGEETNVTINDAYFTRAGVWAEDGAEVVFNSGVINHKPERTSRYIFCAQSGSTITINDGTFTNDRAKNSYFWADNATIYVNGGNFGGVASNNKVVLTNGGQVIITGGTFNFDPTAYVAEGYVATKNGSTWTVSAE